MLVSGVDVASTGVLRLGGLGLIEFEFSAGYALKHLLRY